MSGEDPSGFQAVNRNRDWHVGSWAFFFFPVKKNVSSSVPRCQTIQGTIVCAPTVRAERSLPRWAGNAHLKAVDAGPRRASVRAREASREGSTKLAPRGKGANGCAR